MQSDKNINQEYSIETFHVIFCCTKTKSDLKMFYEWFLSNGEMRMIEDIPFPELDELLARLYLGMFEQNFLSVSENDRIEMEK
jgi:hypothetical protein